MSHRSFWWELGTILSGRNSSWGMSGPMHCRIIGFLVAASLLGAQCAQAADLSAKPPVYKAPVAAPYNWTGFYVGANAGYGWDNANISIPAIDPTFIPEYQAYLPA